jgi:hypothetical protein
MSARCRKKTRRGVDELRRVFSSPDDVRVRRGANVEGFLAENNSIYERVVEWGEL